MLTTEVSIAHCMKDFDDPSWKLEKEVDSEWARDVFPMAHKITQETFDEHQGERGKFEIQGGGFDHERQDFSSCVSRLRERLPCQAEIRFHD